MQIFSSKIFCVLIQLFILFYCSSFSFLPSFLPSFLSLFPFSFFRPILLSSRSSFLRSLFLPSYVPSFLFHFSNLFFFSFFYPLSPFPYLIFFLFSFYLLRFLNSFQSLLPFLLFITLLFFPFCFPLSFLPYKFPSLFFHYTLSLSPSLSLFLSTSFLLCIKGWDAVSQSINQSLSLLLSLSAITHALDLFACLIANRIVYLPCVRVVCGSILSQRLWISISDVQYEQPFPLRKIGETDSS